MKINIAAVRKCLKMFDFKTLFREHLGWDNYQAQIDIFVDGKTFHLTALAQKRGFVAFYYPSIPDRPTRLKIDHQITKSAREHFVIYTDQPNGRQIWQWVRREPGKPVASRDHRFDITQSGDPLIQRLDQIAVALDEEEKITVVDIAGRARFAFDVDKVTKKFYDRFKAEHTAFVKLIKGIKADAELQWYASLMLNRLMFVYFIQKKGFLDDDVDYLRNRLKRVQAERGKDKFQSFYRYFLLRLFHDGLGKSAEERKLDAVMENLLGKVPYLNGGFFEVHQLEERNTDIDIPDKAFERLFDFFDQYSWHLDERPLRADNEINPDVVGYIFEKYINQKQMGAYYTKEDITEYISKNTIIPFLFDTAKKKCNIAFNPESALWRLLRDDPDRYIYPAVGHSVIYDYDRINHRDHKRLAAPLPLPAEIEAGVKNVSKREGWNKPAPEAFALPTETWREVIARRQRCLDIREKLSKGEVHEINDLITLNIDIWQFARDAMINAEGPELLRAFWHAIEKVTVLDPTCGSGAFLFAALRILQTLYSDCLERMERFVEDADHAAAINPEDQVRALIDAGEGAYAEFKSSARWDIEENKYNPVLEDVIVKTVAGFLNGHGGTLLIGVNDSGKIVGLRNDYLYTKPQNPNRDQFELWLNQHLANKLDKFVRPFFTVDFTCLDGKEVCRIIVHRSPKPVFVENKGQEILYARQGNATVPYSKPSDILAYTKQHWPADQPVPNPPPPTSPYAIPPVKPSAKGKAKYEDFRQTLALLNKHPSSEYFILKSIIICNLFGVDIMEEAVEICKLRLFLKLVAQVETVGQIEPLPDIDFNIRAGNTLVGFASLEQVRKSQKGSLGFGKDQVNRIEEDAKMVEKAFKFFRAQQTTHGGKITQKDKLELRTRLAKLDAELDRCLAGEYVVNVDKQKNLDAWKTSHEPFHWFVEFYGIMAGGGFDVIIGNPPYVEYTKVESQYAVLGYHSQSTNNLYAMTSERAKSLLSSHGCMGVILPNSSVSAEKLQPLQQILTADATVWVSHFAWRPSKLFEGANMLLAIWIIHKGMPQSLFTTRYQRWSAEYRPHLFPTMHYLPIDGLRATFRIPKMPCSIAISIYKKCMQASNKASLLDRTGTGSYSLYFFRAVLYWFKVLVSPPVLRENGVETTTSEMKTMSFSDEKVRDVALAVLSSNLFALHYTVWSSCQVVNSPDLMFPVNLDELTRTLGDELQVLAKRLVKDVNRNSMIQRRKYAARGREYTMEKQYFFFKRSKTIIDNIDAVLARHYGFTGEELDFIINYDIKYRMGGADGEEGDDQ